MPQSRWLKDPAAVLDYKFDWAAETNGSGASDWLAVDETITAKTVAADTGITVDSSEITDAGTSVTVWLSGGTVGVEYHVTCLITTSAGRKDKRTVSLQVRNR